MMSPSSRGPAACGCPPRPLATCLAPTPPGGCRRPGVGGDAAQLDRSLHARVGDLAVAAGRRGGESLALVADRETALDVGQLLAGSARPATAPSARAIARTRRPGRRRPWAAACGAGGPGGPQAPPGPSRSQTSGRNRLSASTRRRRVRGAQSCHSPATHSRAHTWTCISLAAGAHDSGSPVRRSNRSPSCCATSSRDRSRSASALVRNDRLNDSPSTAQRTSHGLRVRWWPRRSWSSDPDVLVHRSRSHSTASTVLAVMKSSRALSGMRTWVPSFTKVMRRSAMSRRGNRSVVPRRSAACATVSRHPTRPSR